MVLRRGIAEMRPWACGHAPIVHLFCDASGNKGYMGAVLLIDGQCPWTHAPLESRFMQHFRRRRDKQILGLELAAIGLGLSTFAEELAGRSIIAHCDNSGAEVGPPFHFASHAFVAFDVQGLHATWHRAMFRSCAVGPCAMAARGQAANATLDPAGSDR